MRKNALIPGFLLAAAVLLTACGSAETVARGGDQTGNVNGNMNTAAAGAMTATPAPAPKKQDDAPKFEKGENYESVRGKLLKAGWQPFKSPDAQPCTGDDPRCRNYPEMEACAGTGLGNCRYLWKRGAGQTLVIFTVGEDPVYDGQEFEKPKAPAKPDGAAGRYVYSYKHESGADTFVYELKANGVATYQSEREGGDGEDLTGTWDESEGVVTIAFKNETGKNDFIDFALENGNLRQLTDPRTKGQERGVRSFVGTIYKRQR